MTKTEELIEFLAWVQDNYLEVGEEMWECITPRIESNNLAGSHFTREEVVQDYLDTML